MMQKTIQHVVVAAATKYDGKIDWDVACDLEIT
jgi:hypothetical protein